ncbi:MAG: nucleoside triphosphate pyrophosphohydrolase [Anaerolineales bacterium]
MDRKQDFNEKLIILGLGPGDAKFLTREAWEVLSAASEVYLRTQKHPTVGGFPSSLHVRSFDDLYEQADSFTEVYEGIVKQVLALSERPEGVVYAVPGDPYIAEATTPAIIQEARTRGIPFRVVSGLSYLEPTFSALGLDPLPSTVLLDALELTDQHHPNFPPDIPALIAQVHSPWVASHLKLTLFSVYPDHHPVRFIHRAGTEDEKVENLSLYEIDHSPDIGLLTSLYVPPLAERTSFEAFQEIIARLRAPGGCPWDREQDHQSLRPHLLEETYEALTAIDEDDPEAMKEEFGDLLLQIVLHAQIASEYGEFGMADVLHGVHTKIVNRHPHVFDDLDIDETEDVLQNWEQLKAEERYHQGGRKEGLLDGVAPALPSLSKAQIFQKRAARVGFDWPELGGVLDKISEELGELKKEKDPQSQQKELGDLLFAVVNLSRWYDLDAESALRGANQRFKRRFSYLEKAARSRGCDLSDLSLQELDELWEEAKRQE